MSRHGIEIEFQAIPAEHGQVRDDQRGAEVMNQAMGPVLSPWAEKQGRDELRGGIQCDLAVCRRARLHHGPKQPWAGNSPALFKVSGQLKSVISLSGALFELQAS